MTTDSRGIYLPRDWADRAAHRRVRRLMLRLSEAQVAGRLGITLARFKSWERGRARPSASDEREWDDALFAEAP